MKSISLWAKHHVAAARFYIIAIKILLTALAYYTGITLYKLQLVLPYEPTVAIALVLLLAAVLLYPASKKNGTTNSSFAVRKLCDFILPLAAVLFFVAWISNADTVNAPTTANANTIIKKKTAQDILNSGKTKETLTRQEKKVLKKEFFKQLKVYAGATLSGDKAKAGEAWKIILAIIGLVGLLYLLAALACSLSCNGSDAAAVIVGVLGLVGLIWGFIAVLKAIKRGPKNKPEKTTE